MKKFEYKFYQLDKSKLETKLNELGSKGWEMIYFNEQNEMIFKREVEIIVSNKLGILNDQFSDEINLENLKKK
jgi:hypothetical protein